MTILVCQVSLTLTQSIRLIEEEQIGRCEPVTNIICKSDHPSGYFPNFRNHYTQKDAGQELFDFLPLIESGCSALLRPFLCGYYFPLCFTDGHNKFTHLKPCKSLCEAARNNCSKVLRGNSELEWPEFLDCSSEMFPCDGSTLCFGPELGPPTSCNITKVSDIVMHLLHMVYTNPQLLLISLRQSLNSEFQWLDVKSM